MPHPLLNRLKFRLERLVLRGAHYRLLIIAALLGLLSVLAGAIVHYFDAGFSGDFGDATWWAFLRLSDPGYLGDDHGTLERIVSTTLTVLGYVLFLGALVAIMTQWLNERMRELEAGLTPIAQRDHVLIIGWTNRTATIVRELVLSSERVRRFLRRHGARTLRLVILADEVTTALNVELRDRLGPLWNERQVVLRTGSPLRLEHLRRVDFLHAAAVILPAADFAAGGSDLADTHTIKTLLGMSSHAPAPDETDLPLAVAEILDSRKIDVARRAYAGPVEILASDAIISRLMAQNIRHRGLSHVYGELLTHGRGNEIYVRGFPEFAGMRFDELPALFPEAVLLGIVRPVGESFHPLLNPPPDTRLEQDDRLAMLAHGYRTTAPAGGARAAATEAETAGAGSGRSAADAASPSPAVQPIPVAARERAVRVLVLGWSHKVPALLRELDGYAGEAFEVDVVSMAPLDVREAALRRQEVAPRRVTVRQIEDDYTTAAVLERLEPGRYDNVLLVGSDRLGSGEESDARSILGHLLLRDLLPDTGGPAVLLELLDPGNLTLFRRARVAGEVIISPVILSHMLAQVALRRELRAVFDELFGPAGAEIVFRTPSEYGIDGRDVPFRGIEAAAGERGEIALGVRASREPGQRAIGVALNPPRERRFRLGSDDEIIALTTYASATEG